MGPDMIFWYFGFQLAILCCLVMIFFKLGAVVEVLNHHFVQVHDKQQNIMEELEHIESNTKQLFEKKNLVRLKDLVGQLNMIPPGGITNMANIEI